MAPLLESIIWEEQSVIWEGCHVEHEDMPVPSPQRHLPCASNVLVGVRISYLADGKVKDKLQIITNSRQILGFRIHVRVNNCSFSPKFRLHGTRPFSFGRTCPSRRPSAISPAGSRGVGGSGHGYNSLLQPAGRGAESQQIDFRHPCFRFLMAPRAPSGS